MKPITEKQKNAIIKLAGVTATHVGDLDSMSSKEASKIIDDLIKKKTGRTPINNYKRQNNSTFSRDALAGLAVKILAQKHDIKEIISQRERFKERVVELYQIFDEARQGCLA